MTNYFLKIRDILFHPTAFFQSVVPEQGYQFLLWFYAITFFCVQVVSWLLAIPLFTVMAYSAGSWFLVFMIIIGFFGAIISAFASPFVSSGITHLGVMMMGGKKGFYATYKATTYSMFVAIAYSLLISIVSFIMFFLEPGALDMYFNSSKSYSYFFSVTFLLTLLIAIVMVIHSLIVQTKGIKAMQELSTGRAFFAIIIIPLILFVALVLFFIMLFALAGAASSTLVM